MTRAVRLLAARMPTAGTEFALVSRIIKEIHIADVALNASPATNVRGTKLV